MMRTPEFKVGLFVLICLAIVAAMSLQVNKNPSILGKAKRYDALLPNANGLVKNSEVKLAGVPVGIIKDIKLDDGKARVVLELRGDLPVKSDASVELKPNGILGDKYLEIKTGSPEAQPLPEGGLIVNVEDKTSFDSVLNQVGKIAKDVGEITENLKKATSGEGDENSPVGRTIKNVEELTANLRDISRDDKEKIESTIDNIHSITKTLNEFVNDESDEGFKANWRKMAKSLGRVDSILRNVDEITAKVNSGKGTLGKLVNDEQTVEELNHAIAGVNNMLDTANKFQISVDYHSEFMPSSMVKSYIGINIQPGPDRYYIVQVVDDPRGYYDSTSSQQTTGGTTTTAQTNYVYHNRLEVNAEFAKVFNNLTLRAGIIQNTGGGGIDYSFLNRKLIVSAEAFQFGRPEGVDVRVYAKYKFYSIFYAIFGGDDITNTVGNSFTGAGAVGFIGAGIDFTNDDLKTLLARVPF